MTDPIDAELDALFRLVPSALVEARNALADRLRKAGDKAGAARVKALKRPAPAAWALNQVYFRQPLLLERARVTTAQVRALHARDAVHPRALMDAHESQRAANNAVVEAALKHSEAAGLPGGASQQRKVLATLQALLAGTGDEIAGRLTHELEPSGFGAIDDVGAPSPRVASAASAAAIHETRATTPESEAPAAKPRPDLKLRQRAAEVLAQRENAARTAQTLVLERSRAVQGVAQKVADTQTELHAAERALAALRDQLSLHESERKRAQSLLEESKTNERRCTERVERARAELAVLTQD